MIRRVIPSRAKGTVCAPPSKSLSHRLLIGAALAPGESRITGLGTSLDIEATAASLRALGAGFSVQRGTAAVTGIDFTKPAPASLLPCGESGSTLRFLLPLCLLRAGETTLAGTERLFARGLSVYEEICRERGILFRQEKDRVTVKGLLIPGIYALPGNVSSQFITGLLYALPTLPGDSEIRLTTALQSAPYLDMTLSALRAFGVRADRTAPDRFLIPGGQRFAPRDLAVEGDWSNAAFLLALNGLGGDLSVTGLYESSPQGDKVCKEYLEAIRTGAPTLDVSDCPDLAPVLMACAALHRGAVLTGTARLRIKESDRGEAMAAELRKCGAAVTVEEDCVTVSPGKIHPPAGPLCGHNDHRVVMALTILLSVLGGCVTDAEAVAKSWPDFFKTLESIGVKTVETDDR